MNIRIAGTTFGVLEVEGDTYHHDVLISPTGEIAPRQKEHSREAVGTSHIVTAEELKASIPAPPEKIIIGTGQNGQLRLSEDARTLLESWGTHLHLAPTPQAIVKWNEERTSTESLYGLFHVTC